MSVYLGYDTVTKQYLKDLVSNKNQFVKEWANYYVNVSATYTWPHGIANFPCSVRHGDITESTNITIKTLSFDDVPIATLNNNTLDVRARFVRPDKTVITKDLISIDLSSKFSATMIKDKSTNWTSKPKVAGSIPTVVRLIFQLAWCGIYTQSNNTLHKSTNVFCFVVNEKINVGEAKGAMLFQIGVKFKTGVSNTPELAVVYEIS